MTVYTIKYKKAATKGLMKIPKGIATKIETELLAVAESPEDYSGDWKPLVNSPYHRLRVGKYRAVCQLINDQLILYVIKIGTRGGIYK